jgi:dTDP-glucose 4,6-dehydratase
MEDPTRILTMSKKIILTGCAGFIGSNFVKNIAQNEKDYQFLIIDALTYAGRFETIEPFVDNQQITFQKVDIRDREAIQQVFNNYQPQGVIHFAAESHVDRSITNPNIFVETNVLGTMNLLNASLKAWENSPEFRFVHVSTDEVYGSLSETDPAFTEDTPLCPNSPYSASKASSDLLVAAYHETYKLPTVITRCSNNYGPYQFPEKLIPLMIDKAQKDQQLPVYGNGKNIRDWIFVDDHNTGVWLAFKKGKVGQAYNFGGQAERRNIDVVKSILKFLDKPESLISFVEDRKGHDWRYAINFTKASEDLGWAPTVNFEQGLERTINWYQQNQNWVRMVQSK